MEMILFLLIFGGFGYFLLFTEKGQDVWASMKAWFDTPDDSSRPPPAAMLAAIALLGALLIGKTVDAQMGPATCGAYASLLTAAEQNDFRPQFSWVDSDGDKFVVFANRARKVFVVVIYRDKGVACLSDVGTDFTVEKKHNEV
jgi:hypothetical protein